MRLHFQTDSLPRRMARKLQRATEANGSRMKLGAAQNQIARMFGYRNYLELKVIVAQGAAGNSDRRSADDYRSTAVARLAVDNGWTVELAEQLFEPIFPLLKLALVPLGAPFDARGDESRRPPVVVIRTKRRTRDPRGDRPKVTVFDLGGENTDDVEQQVDASRLKGGAQ